MPELPEVETYARDLDRLLRGCTFTGARVGWPAQLAGEDPGTFASRLSGRQVRGVSRRGKLLVFQLDDGALVLHLRMSGRPIVAGAGEPVDPHAHLVLDLAGGRELRLRDPRKFGRAWLVADPETVLGRLGPEPLDPAFTADAMARRLGARRCRLKPLLLDQEFVAGLGNIYVDESLWAARLHPQRRADEVGRPGALRLHAAIVDVLRRAVAARGSTLRDGGYRDLTGNPGEMQGSLAVYGRAGAPCPRCAAPIRRIVVAGRGTHLCPRCQRPRR